MYMMTTHAGIHPLVGDEVDVPEELRYCAGGVV
jgi:hypothetical protein